MPDRFEDLRTFVAVVQGGGFAAAGKRLGLPKSAVSRRVRDLEDRLGARLLERTTRRVRATEAGATFHERAVRLLADLQDAEDLAAAGAQEAVGKLRVSAPVSLTTHCLAPVIGGFMARHPRLELDIETSDRVVDLLDGGFDMAVRISRLEDSTLIARRLAPIRHVAVASPAYLREHGRPEKPADLARHRGLVYGYADPRRYWLFRDGETVDVPSRLSFSNGDAIREAAVAGAGVAMLPTFIAHPALARGDLEPLLAGHMRPPIALHAVHPSSRNVPKKVRLFIDFLVERFGEEPFWDRDMPAA